MTLIPTKESIESLERVTKSPWIPLNEFLKSGFEGKCWVFSENIVLETEYDTNGFWYVFKYIDQNTITHVKPIHKPEPPKL